MQECIQEILSASSSSGKPVVLNSLQSESNWQGSGAELVNGPSETVGNRILQIVQKKNVVK